MIADVLKLLFVIAAALNAIGLTVAAWHFIFKYW